MYKSISSIAREILEKVAHGHMAPDGGPEKDMNDQIAVGHYHTKSFEMSMDAQKLYSNLPKDTNIDDAVAAASLLDQLFDLEKDVIGKKNANASDLVRMRQLVNKVLHLSNAMNLRNPHENIINDVVMHIEKYAKGESVMGNIIDPDDHQHPTDDPRFGTTSKDYNTDLKNDRDIDNVKNFLLKRSLRAQRKLKIIDND
jgi:hypothetical protein